MRLRKRTVDKEQRVSVSLKTHKSLFDIDTDKDDISLPAVIVFSGARGSGKTYACVMLMRHFEIKGYVTRTFLLCPTNTSNDIYSNLKTLRREDSCSNSDLFRVALQNILAEIKKDWLKFETERQYAIAHRKWRKAPHLLDLREQHLIEYRQEQPPEKIPKPSHLIIIDDAQGTDLFRNARKDLLSHIVIKHRHIPVTIALLAQSWTGIPRVIRLNTTQFAVYKTGDKTQLKQIYDTFANTVDYDAFENIYKRATSVPHGFLFIDTVPKKEYKRFRSGFNEYLVLNKEDRL
jgi:thymidylate kinase